MGAAPLSQTGETMTCPLCNKPINDGEPRVFWWPDKRGDLPPTVHRVCREFLVTRPVLHAQGASQEKS